MVAESELGVVAIDRTGSKGGSGGVAPRSGEDLSVNDGEDATPLKREV